MLSCPRIDCSWNLRRCVLSRRRRRILGRAFFWIVVWYFQSMACPFETVLFKWHTYESILSPSTWTGFTFFGCGNSQQRWWAFFSFSGLSCRMSSEASASVFVIWMLRGTQSNTSMNYKDHFPIMRADVLCILFVSVFGRISEAILCQKFSNNHKYSLFLWSPAEVL